MIEHMADAILEFSRARVRNSLFTEFFFVIENAVKKTRNTGRYCPSLPDKEIG